MNQINSPGPSNVVTRMLSALGAPLVGLLGYVGDVGSLVVDVGIWVGRSILLRQVRFGRQAMYRQIVRVGMRSVGIIVLVSFCIGLILALQMAPPLDQFGQQSLVANIIAVGVLRELGPLISAIVLTGFAGASIAAELGTMVVGEEIEALETMALNPVRFLVLPRVFATIISMVVLAVLADLVAIGSGALIGVGLLDIPWGTYKMNTMEQAKLADFLSGVVKAGVFGMLIGLIACHHGLKVTGGAAGVGRATTITVVYAIVSIIFADLMFTGLFYAVGWH